MDSFEDSIEKLYKGYKTQSLIRAFKELSNKYKNRDFSLEMIHKIVYLSTRLPATYAVINKVFSNFSFPPRVLDCGSGPGTSIWALINQPLEQLVLIEKDLDFISIGKKIQPQTRFPVFWNHSSFLFFEEVADLILFSYSLNEIDQKQLNQVIKHAYLKTTDFIVVIEPGTPDGFSRIAYIRKALIDLGMYIHSPCTHINNCPLVGDKKNWCHFYVRLSRSKIHRILKSGQLGYEDEKYSYLIASKTPITFKGSRVLRHPVRHKGFSSAFLCSKDGAYQKNFTGKTGKRVKWGDLIID